MESFAAAIMLGLKKKFNNVDHLNYCIMDAPVPEAGYRKQYMVIFDSVPGGTGYLKELINIRYFFAYISNYSNTSLDNPRIQSFTNSNLSAGVARFVANLSRFPLTAASPSTPWLRLVPRHGPCLCGRSDKQRQKVTSPAMVEKARGGIMKLTKYVEGIVCNMDILTRSAVNM